MTTKAEKLEQLKKVAEVTLTLELARLAQMREEEIVQQARLNTLKDAAKERHVQIQHAAEFDPAMYGGRM